MNNPVEPIVNQMTQISKSYAEMRKLLSELAKQDTTLLGRYPGSVYHTIMKAKDLVSRGVIV